MICLTGAERAAEDVARRLGDVGDVDLQEVRLDLLEDPTTPLDVMLGPDPTRVVVTCRPVRQGGRWDGDESARVERLRDACRLGVGFVDLEADVSREHADMVLAAASYGPTRVVRSVHVFEPGADAFDEMQRLRSLRGHVLKLAIAVADAAELERFVDLGRMRDRPVVMVGMGAAGVLSRVCWRRFGSAWTYVASDAGATAPGQLDLERARAWRLLGGADPSPVALVGGPQVHGSPGPTAYNALFAAERRPWVYLPIETSRPLDALRLLDRIGLVGASITMPHKEAIAPFCDVIDPDVAEIGALNTLWQAGGRWLATNTDGVAAADALEARRPLDGARVLLLGAGGTARAVAVEAARRGARIAVHNRTAALAAALAEAVRRAVGADVEIVGDPARHEPDVLVNATPIGLGGRGCPVDEGTSLAGRVVLDCVGQPAETPLVRRARREGAAVVDGRELWLRQGALQASLWLGRAVSLDELRGALDGAAGPSKPA